jgi:hypothetical protein
VASYSSNTSLAPGLVALLCKALSGMISFSLGEDGSAVQIMAMYCSLIEYYRYKEKYFIKCRLMYRRNRKFSLFSVQIRLV